jgi:hypothetical protein
MLIYNKKERDNMGTIKNIQIEIMDLDTQIQALKRLSNDYKSMAAGDWKHSEIREEIESLRLERNKLLATS